MQRIITQAYTAVVAVAVKDKLPESELTISQTSTKQTKARPNRKTAESGEQISAMKRNQNIYNDVPAISPEVVETLRLSTHRTSIILGKLGTIHVSKSNLKDNLWYKDSPSHLDFLLFKAIIQGHRNKITQRVDNSPK